MKKRDIFRAMFESFIDSFLAEDPDRYEVITSEKWENARKLRSTSMERIYGQLRKLLYDEEEWSYPLDVYVGDDGRSLFTIIAQSGKLYQAPVSIAKDTVALGTWTQVKEEFTPIEQSFRVLRQKDGKYRWTCIAGTTILNRVGEIDSSELFDSFVEHAERTGEYPRLDFYHMGSANPEAWEFGTADFLAREGVCYVASGTFDENHPLAKATIQAYERDGDGVWGNSVEFYALSKSEVIVVEPEVRVPVYKKGKNTRISIVLEEDAAGLFTRIGVTTEGVTRTMDSKTKDKLTALYGDDSEGLEAFIAQFEQSVDGVNRTVKDENLIHRAKKDDELVESDPEKEAGEAVEDDEIVIDIDAETIDAISQQVTESKEFKSLATGISEIKKLVGELVVARENDSKEITRLNKEVERLGKDDVEKKTEYLQDLPSRKRTHITHRPRNGGDEDSGPEDMAAIASRNLSKISAASRY